MLTRVLKGLEEFSDPIGCASFLFESFASATLFPFNGKQ